MGSRRFDKLPRPFGGSFSKLTDPRMDKERLTTVSKLRSDISAWYLSKFSIVDSSVFKTFSHRPSISKVL